MTKDTRVTISMAPDPPPQRESVRRHTTQAFPAYEPPPDPRLWRFVAGGLIAMALLAPLVRSVCAQETTTSTEEPGVGVRHEQRGTTWYHCEPWIQRALRR